MTRRIFGESSRRGQARWGVKEEARRQVLQFLRGDLARVFLGVPGAALDTKQKWQSFFVAKGTQRTRGNLSLVALESCRARTRIVDEGSRPFSLSPTQFGNKALSRPLSSVRKNPRRGNRAKDEQGLPVAYHLGQGRGVTKRSEFTRRSPSVP